MLLAAGPAPAQRGSPLICLCPLPCRTADANRPLTAVPVFLFRVTWRQTPLGAGLRFLNGF